MIKLGSSPRWDFSSVVDVSVRVLCSAHSEGPFVGGECDQVVDLQAVADWLAFGSVVGSARSRNPVCHAILRPTASWSLARVTILLYVDNQQQPPEPCVQWNCVRLKCRRNVES